MPFDSRVKVTSFDSRPSTRVIVGSLRTLLHDNWLALSEPPACRRQEGGESKWRRRESNPRPRARHRRNLHACPLLLIRDQPGEETKTASR